MKGVTARNRRTFRLEASRGIRMTKSVADPIRIGKPSITGPSQ